MQCTKGQQNKRFIIIGAGISGILSAIKLRERGINNFVIYEKGDSPGGTWRENTYPGLACDVPAHTYTFSFEPNPDWSRVFAPGPEIRDYIEHTAKKYNVYESICFYEEVTRCEYNGSTWKIETQNGTLDSGDFVIAATGVLHHPYYPTIEGMENFTGKMMHSARWDHDAPLDDQRIAVIGNGSTGVQLVSALAPRAANVVHYQRTPQWVRPVENPYFTEEQKELFRANSTLLHEMRNDPQFYEIVDRFSAAITDPKSPEAQEIQQLVSQNLEHSISDPELKKKLTPNHQAGCKRLVSSPDYYQQIQRPNVETVTAGIDHITETGILDNEGVFREFDLIALATGFRAHDFMRPMEVIGRNGAELNNAWQKRPVAYYAISIPDFPNFFMLNGPNSPVGNASLIDIAEKQWGYIEQLIDTVLDKGATGICATQEALLEFEEKRIAAAKKTIFATGGCNSWYLDEEGVPATWPWKMKDFYEEMKRPKLTDFEIIYDRSFSSVPDQV